MMRPYHIQVLYFHSAFRLRAPHWGGRAFLCQTPFLLCWTLTCSLLLEKLSILTKVPGDPETLLNYVAIGSDCRRTSCDTRDDATCLYPTFQSSVSISFGPVGLCSRSSFLFALIWSHQPFFLLKGCFPHTLPPQSGVIWAFSRTL